MTATLASVSRGGDCWVCSSRLRCWARSSSESHSSGLKSSSLRKLRPFRFVAISAPRVSLDGTGHAPGPATSPTQLGADDQEDLDALVGQVAVRGGVAFVAQDH